MGWIGCVRGENIQRDFVARTFAFIAPVQPILHRVSCSNEMVPNAPKHYETHQNMSLGPDGVDRVDLLEKNSNATLWLELLHLLQQFVPFSTEYRKATERSQMHPNTTEANKSLGSNGVDRVHSLLKIQTRLRGMKFCINCSSSANFAPSFMQ